MVGQLLCFLSLEIKMVTDPLGVSRRPSYGLVGPAYGTINNYFIYKLMSMSS